MRLVWYIYLFVKLKIQTWLQILRTVHQIFLETFILLKQHFRLQVTDLVKLGQSSLSAVFPVK